MKRESNNLTVYGLPDFISRCDQEEAREDAQPILSLPSGAIHLLTGINGSGKTTLLEQWAGLRDEDRLDVTYGNCQLWRSLAQVDRSHGSVRRRKPNREALLAYSYACQQPEDMLYLPSVKAELEMSLRPYRLPVDVATARIEASLVAVGLNSSWLNRNPIQMSGGQRRRVALAAALCVPAKWYLLDEPTAGLDATGLQQLRTYLQQLCSQGCGVVIISHDLEWALPMTSRVLLLTPDSKLTALAAEQVFADPHWLEQAGLNIPLWLQAITHYKLNGAPRDLLTNVQQAAVWLGHHGVQNTCRQQDHDLAFEAHSLSSQHDVAAMMPKRKRERHRRHRLEQFDPRAVWLSYLLISVAMFTLQSWTAWAGGALITATLLLVGRISLYRWRALLAGFLFFGITVSLFSGFGATSELDAVSDLIIGPWQSAPFLATLFVFSRTFLVLLLGLSIPIVMTPLAMRRSLEQVFSWRGHSLPVIRKLILTVTLMMRFVPVLLEEWEKMTRLRLARGKQLSSYTPWALVRRLQETAIPFLLSLFRSAEHVSLALESRGLSVRALSEKVDRTLRWRIRDGVFLMSALLLALGVLGLALWK